jgi:hypothetical protein
LADAGWREYQGFAVAAVKVFPVVTAACGQPDGEGLCRKIAPIEPCESSRNGKVALDWLGEAGQERHTPDSIYQIGH